MSFLGNNFFEGFGCCIYCGSTENLSDEHVIPKSIAGSFVIGGGSCRDCAEDTSAFEGQFIRRNYSQLRRHLKFPRNSKQRKRDRKNLKSEINVGELATEGIATGQMPPPPAIAPWLPTAGILCGRPESEVVGIEPMWTNLVSGNQAGREESVAAMGPVRIGQLNEFSVSSLLRVLAKIGHGFAVVEYGLNGFKQYIPERIIKRLAPQPVSPTRKLTHLIGSERVPNDFPVPMPTSHNVCVGIREVNGVDYVVAYIQLFSAASFPFYEVVVGEASSELMLKLVAQGEIGMYTSRHKQMKLSMQPRLLSHGALRTSISQILRDNR